MKKYSILGNPIAHSKSPIIYDYIFKKLNIDAQYDSHCIETDSSFKDLIYNNKNYCGYNITYPFKNLAYNVVDQIHSSACLLNSVNCIKIHNEELIGYNTDYYGFKMLMKNIKDINFSSKKFLILGNGSTARTVSIALNNLYNAEIFIWGRNKKHVQNFINVINNETKCPDSLSLYQKTNMDTYILINCLPINILENDIENIYNNILFENMELLIDVNYAKNKLRDKLNEINLQTISGQDMLLYQAFKNLDIWFDEKYLNKINFNTLKKNIFKK